MLLHFDQPIPCTTPLGNGYILYVRSNGMLENDEFTVVLMEDGGIKHFTSDQVKVWTNSTYGINRKK